MQGDTCNLLGGCLAARRWLAPASPSPSTWCAFLQGTCSAHLPSCHAPALPPPAGALLKGDQLPTVVFTAQYFITVDCVMMVQVGAGGGAWWMALVVALDGGWL